MSTVDLRIVSNPPRGIKVCANEFGRSLIATRSFQKGDLVYIGTGMIAPDIYGDNFAVIVDGIEYKCTRRNSVWDSDGKRQYYGFDGFTNHSCEPNISCPLVPEGHDLSVYPQDIMGGLLVDNKAFVAGEMFHYFGIALEDIAIGDELTNDYAQFDYNCEGHEIPTCWCGVPTCRGSMLGFKKLSIKDQQKVWKHVYPCVKKSFLQDHPEYQEDESGELALKRA